MSLKIKLVRVGRKKRPFYRIVVAEERSKVTGKVVDTLGYYDPQINPPKIQINQEQLNKWLNHGSRPTAAVKKLLNI